MSELTDNKIKEFEEKFCSMNVHGMAKYWKYEGEQLGTDQFGDHVGPPPEEVRQWLTQAFEEIEANQRLEIADQIKLINFEYQNEPYMTEDKTYEEALADALKIVEEVGK